MVEAAETAPNRRRPAAAVVTRARGVHHGDTDAVCEHRPPCRGRVRDGDEDEGEHREDERGDFVRCAPPARLELERSGFRVFGSAHNASLPNPQAARWRHPPRAGGGGIGLGIQLGDKGNAKTFSMRGGSHAEGRGTVATGSRRDPRARTDGCRLRLVPSSASGRRARRRRPGTDAPRSARQRWRRPQRLGHAPHRRRRRGAGN